MNGVKVKYPRALVLPVAAEICRELKPVTDRLCCAGSLRRGRDMVSDVEILYVPRFECRQVDLLTVAPVDLAAERIGGMLRRGVIDLRLNVKGAATYGPKNKLVVHRAIGVPVDLFAATAENWFNYLVCRTGPKESNMRIASAALARGWHWNPYGAGFSRTVLLGDEIKHDVHVVTSEREVFEFVGLPYAAPELRL